MKKQLSLFVLLLAMCSVTAQNLFSKLGYKKQVMYTSSKGEFEEFHGNPDVVEIGSVYFNTKTNKVVGYVNEEKEKAEVATSTSAMSVDPKCEKYYWISPYAYCLNNPIKFIDPDGEEIRLYDIQSTTSNGWVYGKVSPELQKVLVDVMKTEAGRAYFGQFARAGQTIGNHTFKTDGKYADNVLNVYDYSFSKIEGNNSATTQGEDGQEIDTNTGEVVTSLKFMSCNQNQGQLGETVAEETQLHGYNDSKAIDAYNSGGKKAFDKTNAGNESGRKDHTAFNNKDTKHQGYQNYQQLKAQLDKITKAYQAAFDAAASRKKSPSNN